MANQTVIALNEAKALLLQSANRLRTESIRVNLAGNWMLSVDLEVIIEGLDGEVRVLDSHIDMLVNPPVFGPSRQP